MISHFLVIDSPITDPYENIAIEKVLTDTVSDNQFILYLWQNDKTVVIGKNQNCFSQCNINAIRKNGVQIARRFSGGGAVYHDLGNLNFSFIMSRENYSIGTQLDIIINALSKIGITAEKTGRNDISVQGKKISGNAFIMTENSCCHHGTILIDVNKDALSDYLYVSKEKLQNKGVQSVRARVGNLKDFVNCITVSDVKSALFQSFYEFGNKNIENISIQDINTDKIGYYKSLLSSYDWIFGRNPISDGIEIYKRFDWGEVAISLLSENGKVKDCEIYSDALNTSAFEGLREIILDKYISSETISSAIYEHIKSIKYLDESIGIVKSDIILNDIAQYIKSINIGGK